MLLLLSCVSNLSAEPPAQPIKIGAALSGGLAFVGEAERRGLQLGVEELNARGGVNGRPLELIVEDNLGEAKSAVSGVMKLLHTDKVDLVFSAFTHITQAVSSTVSKQKKLLLYASSLRTFAEENPFVFRDYYDAYDAGLELARLSDGHHVLLCWRISMMPARF